MLRTLGFLGSPRAMAHDHRLDPPDLDDDESISEQPLGDATVQVAYCAPFGVVCITGAYIGAEFVDESEFALRRRNAWQAAIQRELDDERADAQECARMQDLLDMQMWAGAV